jgi:hypothetical protein
VQRPHNAVRALLEKNVPFEWLTRNRHEDGT